MVIGRITSGFGARWGRAHKGLDIAAAVGTPIHAPLSGEVIASGPASGLGLWVRVRHDDGTVTTYGHVNRTLVRVGEHVEVGQEIAEVGNRGHSTGPHLHVEVQTPEGPRSIHAPGSTSTTSVTEADDRRTAQLPVSPGSSEANGSSPVPLANMFTARILFVASSAATLYASESVG